MRNKSQRQRSANLSSHRRREQYASLRRPHCQAGQSSRCIKEKKRDNKKKGGQHWDNYSRQTFLVSASSRGVIRQNKTQRSHTHTHTHTHTLTHPVPRRALWNGRIPSSVASNRRLEEAADALGLGPNRRRRRRRSCLVSCRTRLISNHNATAQSSSTSHQFPNFFPFYWREWFSFGTPLNRTFIKISKWTLLSFQSHFFAKTSRKWFLDPVYELKMIISWGYFPLLFPFSLQLRKRFFSYEKSNSQKSVMKPPPMSKLLLLMPKKTIFFRNENSRFEENL